MLLNIAKQSVHTIPTLVNIPRQGVHTIPILVNIAKQGVHQTTMISLPTKSPTRIIYLNTYRKDKSLKDQQICIWA